MNGWLLIEVVARGASSKGRVPLGLAVDARGPAEKRQSVMADDGRETLGASRSPRELWLRVQALMVRQRKRPRRSIPGKFVVSPQFKSSHPRG